MGFRENLIRLRSKDFASAKSFAKKVGLSYTTYINYEKGAWPNEDNLIKIASALNVTTDELLGYSPPSEYENCKKRLEQVGLEVYRRPNGQLLVRLGEIGTKNAELKRLYDFANLAEVGLPSKQAVIDLVHGAELTAIQSGFRDALIIGLSCWIIANNQQSPITAIDGGNS